MLVKHRKSFWSKFDYEVDPISLMPFSILPFWVKEIQRFFEMENAISEMHSKSLKFKET